MFNLAKPKRRWFQFSLRSMFVLTAIVAALSSWTAHRMRQKAVEERHVAKLREAGFEVRYTSDKYGEKPVGFVWTPAGPKWLCHVLGRNFFDDPHVASLRQHATTIPDGVWQALGTLTTLNDLELGINASLEKNDIDDDDLKHLSELQSLTRCALLGSRIEGPGLRHLAKSEKLEELDLSESCVGDTDCETIVEQFPRLKYLNLNNTRVTPKGLDVLSSLRELEELNVSSDHSDTVVFEDHQRIEALSVGYDGEAIDLEEVRIANLPALEYLSIPENMRKCSLENLPQLQEARVGAANIRLVDLPTLEYLDWVYSLKYEPSEILLTGLQNLERVELWADGGWDQACRELAGCQKLAKLRIVGYIDDCGGSHGVSDEGLAYLSKCSQLRDLEIGNGNITSEGLKSLSKLSNLKRLHLSVEGIDDSMLKIFLTFPALTELNVSSTDITEKGMQWLRSQKPDMYIN